MSWVKNRSSGASIVPLADRRYHRFVLWTSLSVLALLLVVGVFLSIRARRSMRSQAERMELDISRGLDAMLRAGEDLLTPIEALDGTASRWRSVCATWKNIPRAEVEKILRLQELHGKTIPRWRAELASMDSARLQRETILSDVIREQSLWPPPPPPPLVLAFSDGVRDFANGALEGATWPWLVGKRAYMAVKGFGSIWTSFTLRVILFPHRMSGLSFGTIFGFGLFAVLTGYLLCHAGMKTNAALFSILGILYFVYVVVYAVFLVLLLAHLIE